MLTRRRVLGATILLPGIRAALAETPIRVAVWRDPSCGYCGSWVAHLQTEAFAVDQVLQALGPVQQRLGTPADLLSCHAGQAGGFALEGHVPPPSPDAYASTDFHARSNASSATSASPRRRSPCSCASG